MQIYLDKINELLANIPLVLSALPILWATFVVLDYVYEQCYCKYFNISSLVKKEYKSVFHPKYIVDILLYGISVYIFISININIVDIISIFMIISVIYRIIICKKYKNMQRKIEKSAEVNKSLAKTYRFNQKMYYLALKIFGMIFCFVIIAICLDLYKNSPTVVFWIICGGAIILCGIKNDAFICLLSYVFSINNIITFTIDHINVITKNDKQYAILLPNGRISNDHIVACRIILMKLDNGLTYIVFNTHETKVFDYNEELDVIRYEAARYLRISTDDGFDRYSDEDIAKTCLLGYQLRGRYMRQYFSNNEWKLIEDNIDNDSNPNPNHGKQEGRKVNDSLPTNESAKKNTSGKKNRKH